MQYITLDIEKELENTDKSFSSLMNINKKIEHSLTYNSFMDVNVLEELINDIRTKQMLMRYLYADEYYEDENVRINLDDDERTIKDVQYNVMISYNAIWNTIRKLELIRKSVPSILSAPQTIPSFTIRLNGDNDKHRYNERILKPRSEMMLKLSLWFCKKFPNLYKTLDLSQMNFTNSFKHTSNIKLNGDVTTSDNRSVFDNLSYLNTLICDNTPIYYDTEDENILSILCGYIQDYNVGLLKIKYFDTLKTETYE